MELEELFTTSHSTLETRLFAPLETGKNDSTKNLAVFLHPWSVLGGNMFDPVLRSLKPVFLSRQFHVLLYNSSRSLTGIREGQDLRELVEGTIAKLGEIYHLVILGYSHGSLIASLHPLLPKPIRTSHIFLCYPLGVRGLLTLFGSSTFESALQAIIRDPRSNVLILYGDKDIFTSPSRYGQWVELLNRDAAGQMKTIKIDGADHFMNGSAGEEMCNTVAYWLDG